MTPLFDTHAHLLDSHFDEDRDSVIAALWEAGVGNFVEACCREADIDGIRALLEKYPFLYGSVGIHPEYADMASSDALLHVEKALHGERIVAVGEIGLDYHYETGPRSIQKDAFDGQVAIAVNAGKPVIVHDREAHGDTMDILRAHKNGLMGVMHCYSGSYEDACRYIDMGMYIAFGGALTFRNASRQREIASRLPMDRLVIETDCPYMTPEPFRGKRNDPSKIVYTLEKLAELHRMDPEEAAAITTANARRLFCIDE